MAIAMHYNINSKGRDSIQLTDVVPIHDLGVNAVMLQSLVIRVPRPPALGNQRQRRDASVARDPSSTSPCAWQSLKHISRIIELQRAQERVKAKIASRREKNVSRSSSLWTHHLPNKAMILVKLSEADGN